MIRILEEEDSIATKVVSILGTMISVGLNLTPIVLFYEFFKGKREFKSIPEMMFVSGVFCSSTNLAYGIIKGDGMLILSNTICDSLQVGYTTLFLFFFAEKDFAKYLLYLIIAYDLTFEIIYIFSDVIKFHTSKDVALNFTGIFNIVIGLINVVTPGQNIIKVFKTEDFTLIPIITICFQCLCSSFWGFYGFKDMDIMIILPNLLGVVLTILQIAVYYYFYCKRKGVPPEKPKKEGEIEDDLEENEENDNGPKEELTNTQDKKDTKDENLIEN